MGSAVVLVASKRGGDGSTAVVGVSPNTFPVFPFLAEAGRETHPTATKTIALPKQQDMREKARKTSKINDLHPWWAEALSRPELATALRGRVFMTG